MYDLVADLPLEVRGATSIRRERDTAAGFTRVTTEIHLHGISETGRGEDVTYAAADHEHVATAGLDLEGEYTLDEFSRALEERELFAD